MSICGLWAVARGSAGPGGVIIALSSGKDGRLCMRAQLLVLEVWVGEFVVNISMTDVIPWGKGMVPGTDTDEGAGSGIGLGMSVLQHLWKEIQLHNGQSARYQSSEGGSSVTVTEA